MARPGEWRPKHRFLLGYVTGLVFWAGINYWIEFVMSVHGGLGEIGGTAVFLLFVPSKQLHGRFRTSGGYRDSAPSRPAGHTGALGSGRAHAELVLLVLACSRECRSEHGRANASGAVHRRLRSVVSVCHARDSHRVGYAPPLPE